MNITRIIKIAQVELESKTRTNLSPESIQYGKLLIVSFR